MRRSCPCPADARSVRHRPRRPGDAAASPGLRDRDRLVSRCWFRCSWVLSRAGVASGGVRQRELRLLARATDRATGVAPWPSPAGTKLDAMNWPSRAAPAACAPVACRDVATHRRLKQDVVAGSAVEDVLPASRSGCRLAAPPLSVSLPAPPIRTSSPSPPLAVSCIAAAKPRASITSSPPRPLMTSRSFGLGAGDLHLGSQTRHRTTPLSSAIVITSSPLVPLTMTVSAWPSPTPLPGGRPGRGRPAARRCRTGR